MSEEQETTTNESAIGADAGGDSAGMSDASMRISTELAQQIQEELGENVYLCYQCVKCTSGCPVGQFFDWQPNQIMRMTQLGQEEDILNSETPWLCASCQTCSTRCPQGLDTALIMDLGFDPNFNQDSQFLKLGDRI